MLSRPRGHSAAVRIMSIKKSNDTIGNRIRDLPACSAVPQTTAPPRAPLYYCIDLKLIIHIPHIVFIFFYVIMTYALIRYVYFAILFCIMTNSISNIFVKPYMDQFIINE